MTAHDGLTTRTCHSSTSTEREVERYVAAVWHDRRLAQASRNAERVAAWHVRRLLAAAVMGARAEASDCD